MGWWKRAPDTKTKVETEPPPATTEDVAVWVMHLVPASPRLDEVVDTLRDVFAKVPTRDLFDLDTQIRRRTTWAWATRTPRDARRLVLRSGDSLTVGAAMSMHPNGHVREGYNTQALASAAGQGLSCSGRPTAPAGPGSSREFDSRSVRTSRSRPLDALETVG